jgi:hypothetical protein
MPDVGMSLPPAAARRERVLASLAELVAGGMAERMRRDAAARVLVTARRLMALSATGYGTGGRPGQEAPAAAEHRIVTDLAMAWDPEVLTAAEFVETLTPTETDTLLSLARSWATRVWDEELPLSAEEKRRRLAAA